MTYPQTYMARDFIQNSELYLSQIDGEIKRLQQLRIQVTAAIRGEKQVADVSVPRKGMSAEGRLRVAEAQKARWAKLKKADGKKSPKGKTAAKKAPGKTAAKKAVAAE